YIKLPSDIQVIRKAAGSYAKAANINKDINAQKSHLCNVVFWLFISGIVVMIIFSSLMILALRVLLLLV
ncbi:MAG TPA: hypothetical protein VK487_00970, partial [Candidatus Bathyarchaeia archaeon]|nr:hypothetical protein [Candidatus Bathyarchaeia archaeon]